MTMNPIIHRILNDKYCKECILYESKKYTHVRNKTIEINSRYAPATAFRILFVAESPPMFFFKDSIKYFYALGKIERNELFYNMMSVLFEKEMINFPDVSKEIILDKFKECYYLIDMVKCPINKLKDKRRKRKVIESCASYLNEELHTLNFGKAVFIGKSTFRVAKNHLNLDFNYNVITFPRFKQNVLNFKRELKEILKKVD